MNAKERCQLAERLTPLQYKVTRKHGTEPPFLNSAARRFVPVERLEQEGYGQYLPLFQAARK